MTLVSKFSGSSSGASGDSDMVMMNRPRWRYQNYKNVWGPYFPLSDMHHIWKTFRQILQATENSCNLDCKRVLFTSSLQNISHVKWQNKVWILDQMISLALMEWAENKAPCIKSLKFRVDHYLLAKLGTKLQILPKIVITTLILAHIIHGFLGNMRTNCKLLSGLSKWKGEVVSTHCTVGF